MKKIYLVLFVILSIFVFSCKDNLISDDLSSSQNSGVGQVKVFVKQSRLIGPDVSEVTWNVELYKGNDNYSGKNENGYYLFSGLSDGTYDISVSGKIDEVEKFTGSAQVTITNGNSVSVNVPIVATKNLNAEVQSTGYATITMDMNDKLLSLLNQMGDVAYFEAQLISDESNITASLVNKIYDEQQNLSLEILDNQKTTFQFMNQEDKTYSEQIPAGYYNLSFSGLEEFGYAIKLKDNLVEIGDGLTTNIVLTQNDYELVQGNSYSQGMPTVFYVDNEDGNHTRNENGGIEAYAGTSLSNPIGFRNINSNISGTFYLITDVEAYKEDDESSISYISEKTIASFGTDIFSIINNNNENFSLKFERTFLKNINLTNTTGNGFSLLQCPIDGTVILDTPIVQDSNTDSTVLMSKSSNLEIGQKFSGELGICLSSENWQLGDTVITFENGKPDNANFYIWEDIDMPTGFASTFYIDDNGKLAQYDASTQWVNFAWNDEWPYLITQTQAKNKTFMYVELNDSFTGVLTYDGNRTWYFIANSSDASGNTVYSLYKVSAPTGYTDSVTPEKIEVDGISFDSVQAMDYDNGKLYLVSKPNGYDFTIIDVNDKSFSNYYAEVGTFENFYTDSITSLLVYGNNFYVSTTCSDFDQGNENSITHSAILKYTLTPVDDLNDYKLISEEYTGSDSKRYQLPYYLTQYDDKLTINSSNSSFPENSTFRITDLYSDGNSVYGLLANYGSVTEENSYNLAENIHLRGSIFKLGVNSDDAIGAPKMTATHSYLRDTLVVSGDYKQDFILPRKIVGIYNRKLFIADDGLIPDGSRNLNRFSVFDLDTAVSEFIEVSFDFSVSSASSVPFTVYGSIYENIFN